jgi:hypothetical protein
MIKFGIFIKSNAGKKIHNEASNDGNLIFAK